MNVVYLRLLKLLSPALLLLLRFVAVLGKYIPKLGYLDVLLGADPPTKSSGRFYQRLLATDEEEVFEIAEKHCEEESLVSAYENVIYSAVCLTEADLKTGQLAENVRHDVYQIVRRLILDLGEPYTPPARTATGEAQVLCLPATGEGDELAALMLAQLLERRGVPVEVMSARSLSSEMAELAETRSAPIICVSSVPGTSIVAALHLCKRLRLRLPEKTIYIGIWLRRQVTADPARCVVESLSCDREALPAYVPVSGDSELPVHAFAMHWNRVDAGI